MYGMIVHELEWHFTSRSSIRDIVMHTLTALIKMSTSSRHSCVVECLLKNIEARCERRKRFNPRCMKTVFTCICRDILRWRFSTALVADVRHTSVTSVFRSTRLLDVHAYVQLHDHGDLIVPRVQTQRYGSRSFRVSGPTVWNSLPQNLRSSDISREQFKRKLKTWLFERAYV